MQALARWCEGERRVQRSQVFVGRCVPSISATTHPVPPDDRSGLHICFTAPDRAAVDGFHNAALKAGGRDNGKPGLRADYGPNYYAAFAVDPDGYRIEAWCGKQS
jgi:catechol 2,3-dioxygenase-like lactoylglutathione lyase family enzyme